MGELVSPSKSVAGGLEVSEVVGHGDSVTLVIRKSKTDQLSKGTKDVLGRVPGLGLCPLGVLREGSVLCPPGAGPLSRS